MTWNICPVRSLNARVTLFTLATFVIGMWSLAFYASRMLREDMQVLLAAQQFSTASFVAAEVNGQLIDRVRALETVAREVTPAMLENAAALQSFLEQRPVLANMFNLGIAVTGTNGTVTAEVPRSIGRIGANYMDRDYMVGALKEGKATIGRPTMGRTQKAPVFVMAVPVRDSRAKVIGTLAGVVNLGKPNFLDKITEGHYGKSGGFYVVAPKHRLLITGSDKSRIMQTLPGPGINPAIDRFVQGYEGSAVMVNAVGVEVLSSTKAVPVADWAVSVSLPTDEAFAPIRVMQQRLLLATIVFTLLAGGLTWWMLRRQLAPMLAAAKALAGASDTNQSPQPLPVTSQDEIGDLIVGFNRLLETVKQRGEALQGSEARFRELFENNAAVLLLIEPDSGDIVDANPAAARFYGYSIERMRAMRIEQINTLAPADVAAERNRAVREERNYFVFPHRLASGEIRTVDVRSNPISVGGRVLLFSIVYDITERRRQEDLIKKHNELLTRQKADLEATLGRVKRLEGMISICMSCKKIRAENRDWQQFERYLGEHSDAVFTHGICPECLEKEMKKLD